MSGRGDEPAIPRDLLNGMAEWSVGAPMDASEAPTPYAVTLYFFTPEPIKRWAKELLSHDGLTVAAHTDSEEQTDG